MLSGHQRITRRRNIAENFNRLSRVHERYRRQTDRQTTDDRHTDGRRHIANMNMSSRSLKNHSILSSMKLSKRLEERRELPQCGSGQSPGRKLISVLSKCQIMLLVEMFGVD